MIAHIVALGAESLVSVQLLPVAPDAVVECQDEILALCRGSKVKLEVLGVSRFQFVESGMPWSCEKSQVPHVYVLFGDRMDLEFELFCSVVVFYNCSPTSVGMFQT